MFSCIWISSQRREKRNCPARLLKHLVSWFAWVYIHFSFLWVWKATDNMNYTWNNTLQMTRKSQTRANRNIEDRNENQSPTYWGSFLSKRVEKWFWIGNECFQKVWNSFLFSHIYFCLILINLEKKLFESWHAQRSYPRIRPCQYHWRQRGAKKEVRPTGLLVLQVFLQT